LNEDPRSEHRVVLMMSAIELIAEFLAISPPSEMKRSLLSPTVEYDITNFAKIACLTVFRDIL